MSNARYGMNQDSFLFNRDRRNWLENLSMSLVPVEVRSCTSESIHIPHKRELIGSCCYTTKQAQLVIEIASKYFVKVCVTGAYVHP